MNVAPGDRLGPYEVLSRIGAGGMGEVWKARDTRLERNVAIKVLAAAFAEDAQLRLRFAREAKTISQLNHPHICSLFDVGNDYLVMELLDGESLADRLARGPLPLTDVLRYGAQIAEALDRAHRAGVVHRDLKPGNIMITKSGAKLLDFGLAKSSAAPPTADSTQATLEKPLTHEGTLLGTYQYMAPEQIEGSGVDARTDIFALGAVLYEMATGKRAFEGKTKTSVIAAILRDTPARVSEIQPLAPPALDHVIAKCLSKDPELRWQSAQDVASELSWVEEAEPAVAARPKRFSASVVAAIVLAIVCAVLGAMLMRARRAAPVRRPLVVELALPEGIVAREPAEISPDGMRVAFIAKDQTGSRAVWVRDLASPTARRLAPTENLRYFFWSPDSRWIAFFKQTKLFKVSVEGGDATVLADAPFPRGGATWGSDGRIYFAPSWNTPIFAVPANGGPSRAVTRLAPHERSHRNVYATDDGRIVFNVWVKDSSGRGDLSGVYVAMPDASEKTLLRRNLGLSDWSYSHARFLQRDPEDARILRFQRFRRGVLEKRTQEARLPLPFSAVSGPSRDGTMVVEPPQGSFIRQLVWFGRDGSEQGAIAHRGRREDPQVSSDGRYVAVRIPGSGKAGIAVLDLTRGTETVLVAGADNTNPVWSPDGRTIYYGYNEDVATIYRIAVSAGAAPEAIYRAPDDTFTLDVSPDGKQLLMVQEKPTGECSLLALEIDSRAVRTVVRNNEGLWLAAFSKDGRWLAYTASASGRSDVFLIAADGSGERVQVSTNGGEAPRWATGGRLFFVDALDQVCSVNVTSKGGRIEATAPQVLFKPPVSRWNRMFDVTADGERFLVVTSPPQTPQPIRVLLNWLPAE